MILNLNGLNIDYLSSNRVEGDTLVFLLHGWGANKELFNDIFETIAQKYNVVSFDFPGMGKSDEPKEPWNVSQYADLTIEFIKNFKPKKVILIGHSFGGRVILKMFEQELPFEITKIIFVSSAGIKRKRTLKNHIKILSFKAGKFVLGNPLMKKISPDAISKYKNKHGSEDYKNASAVMKGTLVNVLSEDLSHLLYKVDVPSLLFWGENDTATPISDAYIFEKRIKNAGLVKVKNAGHYAFLEKKVLFNEVVRSFLDIK